jgi:hypothetical protein
MALSGTTKKWIFCSVFILLALVIVFFLNLNGHIFASNWIFFGAMLTALVIFFLRAKNMKPEIKTLMMVLFLFPLIFFKFSTIIPGIQFSIYGLLTNIIPPLNNFRFLYRGVLLVVPVLAALAAVGILGITQKAGKKRYFIYGLVFLFIIFENGYLKIGPSGHFKFTPLKYSKIEKKSDKIILELPIFDHRTHHFLNSRYTINTLFHHNYYVNGRTAYRAHNTNTEVLDNTLLNKNFPDENSFLWLLQNYSVDYVIFNWRPKLIKKKEDYITRIKDLKYHCRIVDRSPEFLVLRLLEYYPVKEIQRRYSHFHLKNRKLYLEFKKPYSGKILMVIAQKKKKQEYDQITGQTRVVLDFPEITPNINGTYIRVLFERPVELKEIALVK